MSYELWTVSYYEMFKNFQSTMSKDWKTSAVDKVEGSASCSKHREGQKEITIFCLSFCYFCFAYCIDNVIFVGHSFIYVDRFGYL